MLLKQLVNINESIVTESSDVAELLKLAKAGGVPIPKSDVKAAVKVGNKIYAYGPDSEDGGFIVFTFKIDKSGEAGDFGGAPESEHETAKEAKAALEELVAKAKKKAGITEAYDSSADFDSEAGDLTELLKKLKKIVNGRNLKQHVADTDSNFDVDTKRHYDAMVKSLRDFDKAFDALYEEMEKAA